jgi:hypothetical protein
MATEAHPPAGNKMVAIATGIFTILLAVGIGLFIVGPGLGAFGDGIKGFMIGVGIGIAANPTLAIIIFLIPIALVLGPIFMGIRALLGGGGGGGH